MFFTLQGNDLLQLIFKELIHVMLKKHKYIKLNLTLRKRFIKDQLYLYRISQMLQIETEFLPENIQWLGLGNKYLECQYEITDNWGTKGLDRKDSYDANFQNEYDFVLDNMKLRG